MPLDAPLALIKDYPPLNLVKKFNLTYKVILPLIMGMNQVKSRFREEKLNYKSDFHFLILILIININMYRL